MPKPIISISLLIALALLVAAAVTYGIANSQPSNGKYDTDSNGLIEIEYLEQLDAIRYDLDGDGVADDSDTSEYENVFPVVGAQQVCGDDCKGYELARSLDFKDIGSYSGGRISIPWTANNGWQPIGPSEFNAVFDGNGHTISNLYIYDVTEPDDSYSSSYSSRPDSGLFGTIGESGAISGIGVINADVTGGSRVGVLAGHNYGTVSDSYATGSVSGNGAASALGGLVGTNDDTEFNRFGTNNKGGIINGSYASVTLSDNSDNGRYSTSLGGLAGSNKGTISNSYATGNVSSNGRFSGGLIGGLIGESSGVISNSYATGNVSGSRVLGGLVGSIRSDGTVIASYATGNISSLAVSTYDNYAGGLAGRNNGKVIASYSTGSISVTWSNQEQVSEPPWAICGGLTGENHGTIIASYTTGSVSGEGDMTKVFGGLIGLNYEDSDALFSLWNIQTSGQAAGVGEGELAGAQGMTTDELQAPTGYTGIYRGWRIDLDNADGDDDTTTGRDDFWDFGASSQYPALKADFNGDSVATWQEFGAQGRPRLVAATPAPAATAAPATPAPTLRSAVATTPASTPAPDGFVALSGGAEHACGLLSDGAVVCWGDNSQGQASPPYGKFTALVSGNSYTCGLRDDRVVVCWGSISGVFAAIE